MSSETPSTVTVPTEDHGDVTLPEPDWCTGHADEQANPGYRADIIHCGPKASIAFRGEEFSIAELVQSPFATEGGNPEFGGRTPGVSVSLVRRTLSPVGLYELAAVLDGYADQLRDLADQLARINERGES